jgi:hypothetical protein
VLPGFSCYQLIVAKLFPVRIQGARQMRNGLLSTLTRALMVFMCALAVAACDPERNATLNSPATDSREPDSVASSFASTATAASGTTDGASRGTQIGTGRYYIEFRARSALSYGHTFAMFGRLNANGSIATREVAGLHPATESPVPWMVGHLVPVVSETGPSDGDLEDKYTTARHRLTMDKARYDEMVAYIRKLQASSPMWHAVFYNCNAFVGDIARHMGLRPPENSLLFPKDYIEELSAMNRSTRS